MPVLAGLAGDTLLIVDRTHLERLPLPESFPPHGNLLTDAMDYLWVEDFQRPQEETRTWTVFDSEGELAGRAIMPPRFNPVEIGEDYVSGVGWDESGVEYVRLFSLDRRS